MTVMMIYSRNVDSPSVTDYNDMYYFFCFLACILSLHLCVF